MTRNDDVARVISDKFSSRCELSEEDAQAIARLTSAIRTIPPHGYVVREGEAPGNRCSVVMSGLAFRQKLSTQGNRQITSIHVRGDFLDMQNLFLNCSDHNVQAMTELVVADLDRAALRDLAFSHPAIGRAMWIDTLVEASIFREWLLNIGRRDARARISHLLCEFAIRVEQAGLSKGDGRYLLPMTQEQLGDAVGLTSVHVNRTLKALEADAVMEREGRNIHIHDWGKIKAIAEFSDLYLHLDQTGRAAPRPVQRAGV